jgi:hypothetical protein
MTSRGEVNSTVVTQSGRQFRMINDLQGRLWWTYLVASVTMMARQPMALYSKHKKVFVMEYASLLAPNKPSP